MVRAGGEGVFRVARFGRESVTTTSAIGHSPIGFEHPHIGRANVQLDARPDRPLEERQHSHFTLDLTEALWQSIPPIQKLRFLQQSIRSLILIRLQ
jgi:hypothetical protein